MTRTPTVSSPKHRPPRAAWIVPLLLCAGSAFAQTMRLPADLVYPHPGHPDSAVVFSHATHVALAENRCTGCHPAAFPMLKRGPVPGHKAMNAGASCGLCHDGKQAFGVRDATACGSCHAGEARVAVAATGAPGGAPGGAADTAAAKPRVPKPHTYPASADSPGRVTFRHKTHAGDAKGCAACHPKPFRMAAVAPLPNGGMHEAAACGACHDGKRSFATDDDATCSRCHRESGARP